MKLIRQPNQWTCGACAVAMVLDLPLERVIEAMGHDGSRKTGDVPSGHTGFSEADTAIAAWRLGYSYTRFATDPRLADGSPIPNYPSIDDLLVEIGHDVPLVLVVASEFYPGGLHAVATPGWASGVYFDPQHDSVRSLEGLPPIKHIEVLEPRIASPGTVIRSEASCD